MQRAFDTPGPTSVYVEIGSGRVTVRAERVNETTVDIHGDEADDTVVEQRGNQIVVIGRKRTGFFRSSDLSVHLTMPTDSELVTKLGSADLSVSGRIGPARLKAGSGDIDVAEIAGAATVEAGSGDIELESAAGPVQLKSGSGDARVGEARGDVTVTTTSGDVTVVAFHAGSLQARNVSGDIRVGVPAGIPVWTDISTMSGHIDSSLEGAGQPADGQEFVELRATTVSGDIRLEEV
jgi:DUF4097 and DUF4098 domain-containing protein YvlB